MTRAESAHDPQHSMVAASLTREQKLYALRFWQFALAMTAYSCVGSGFGGNGKCDENGRYPLNYGFYNFPELQFVVANGVLAWLLSGVAVALTFSHVKDRLPMHIYERIEEINYLGDGLFGFMSVRIAFRYYSFVHQLVLLPFPRLVTVRQCVGLTSIGGVTNLYT